MGVPIAYLRGVHRQIRILIAELPARPHVGPDALDGRLSRGQPGRHVESLCHRYPTRRAPRASASTYRPAEALSAEAISTLALAQSRIPSPRCSTEFRSASPRAVYA